MHLQVQSCSPSSCQGRARRQRGHVAAQSHAATYVRPTAIFFGARARRHATHQQPARSPQLGALRSGSLGTADVSGRPLIFVFHLKPPSSLADLVPRLCGSFCAARASAPSQKKTGRNMKQAGFLSRLSPRWRSGGGVPLFIKWSSVFPSEEVNNRCASLGSGRVQQ